MRRLSAVCGVLFVLVGCGGALRGGKDEASAPGVTYEDVVGLLAQAPRPNEQDRWLVDIQPGVAGDIDLREFDSPIKNQGEEGLCWEFAHVAALDHIYRRDFGAPIDLSVRHYVALERQQKRFKVDPSGPFLVDSAAWPYWQPSPPDVDLAALGRVRLKADPKCLHCWLPKDERARWNRFVERTLTSLAAGEPIVFGIPAARTLLPWDLPSGVVVPAVLPVPTVGDEDGDAATPPIEMAPVGHMVLVVGYRVDGSVPGGGYWLFKNSWSRAWGDHGYGYLPFSACAARYPCDAFVLGAIETR